jgi:flavin reductase (DIM6/NTAB) family NADH-FMN oxidoreductase RutF
MSEEATLERRKTTPKATDGPMRSSSDPEAFREVMRRLSYPVSVVTVELEGGQSHGATVSSFSSVALQPQPLVSLALRRPSRLAAHLVQRPRQPFSVFLLSHHSLSIDLASLFSRPKDRIPSAAFASLQESCLARLDCRVLSSLDLAELAHHHADNKELPPSTNQIGSTLFIGQVLQSTYSTVETPHPSPLMYHNRSYTTVKD